MTDSRRPHLGKLVAEGTVIILSILLAFAIDAAWARNQLRQDERDALVSLEADFIASLEQVDSVIARYESGRQFIATLAELSEDSVRALPQTTISETMLATSNPWTFDPVLGTVDALVGAGRLGILRDTHLREALTSFRNFVEDTEEDKDIILAFATDVWKDQIRLGGPWTDPETEISSTGMVIGFDFLPKATASDLLRVRSDRDHFGLISWFHLNAGYYVSELDRIRAQILTIQDLIAQSRGRGAF